MKAILVTGANSGIGYYSSRRLAANGFYVYAGIRNESNMSRFGSIDNIQPIKLDVTSQDEIDAAAQLIETEGRGLYGIVNNAGITTFSTMNEIEEDQLYRILNTNVFGPYRINKTFSHMLIASSGRTVTIGSISGYLANAGNGAYAISKFAVEGYTDSYALEMNELGVHVSIIEPGGFKTNILRNVDTESLSEEVRESMGNRLAHFDRSGEEPHKVAAAVLDVMSSDKPKHRYMVVPNDNQAKRTVTIALKKAIELNYQQEFEYTQEELITMLEQLLAESSSE